MNEIWDEIATRNMKFMFGPRKSRAFGNAEYVTWAVRDFRVTKNSEELVSDWLDSLDPSKVVILRTLPEISHEAESITFRVRFYQEGYTSGNYIKEELAPIKEIR